MSSEDTGGYFDGYIPATKEGLNKAIEELRKEIKQIEKILEELQAQSVEGMLDRDELRVRIEELEKSMAFTDHTMGANHDDIKKDIVDIKEKVVKALAAAKELQGDLKEVPAKRKPNPEGKEEKAEATALTLRLYEMNPAYHAAHFQVPKETRTTVRACEQLLLL